MDTRGLPQRKRLRLACHDYSRACGYFVTVVTKERRTVFGQVVDDHVHLNDVGRHVVDAWLWLATRFEEVDLHAFVLMPNHLHAILWLTNEGPNRRTLGAIIGAFKLQALRNLGPEWRWLWQRGFHDRVIRSAQAYLAAEKYIENNPAMWARDINNPRRNSGG